MTFEKNFQNRRIVLLTKHQKEDVIKPVLEDALGCEVITENGFDTDRLGSFSREKKRRKSQLDTAQLKAKKGISLSGCDIGVASEGSFGMHPYAPVPWNIEIVFLYDKVQKLEVYGVYEGTETNFDHKLVTDYEACHAFALSVGFPDHYLILRPNDEHSKWMIKGIDSIEGLEYAFHICKKRSHRGEVFIETDMRAFANPTRMKNIERATQNLVEKLMSVCPNCDTPGFSVTDIKKGLPCEECGLPSELAISRISVCKKCKHTKESPSSHGSKAPARYCHYCNP